MDNFTFNNHGIIMMTLDGVFDKIKRKSYKRLVSLISEEEAVFLKEQIVENEEKVLEICKAKNIYFPEFEKRINNYRKIIPTGEVSHNSTVRHILGNCSATKQEVNYLLLEYSATEIIQGKRVNGKWQPKEIIGKTIG